MYYTTVGSATCAILCRHRKVQLVTKIKIKRGALGGSRSIQRLSVETVAIVAGPRFWIRVEGYQI
jgi:hypothetical protein